MRLLREFTRNHRPQFSLLTFQMRLFLLMLSQLPLPSLAREGETLLS